MGCHQGTRPGAKIFDAKFCASDLAQIFIDIARFNGNRRARLVDILEQFVTWSFAILRRFDLREKKHLFCSQSKNAEQNGSVKDQTLFNRVNTRLLAIYDCIARSFKTYLALKWI